MNIKDEIKKHFSSLEEFKSFDVIEQELGAPIIEADYDAIKTEIGINLRPCFHKIFSQYDRFKFRLELEDNVISECVIDGLILTFNVFAQEHYLHAFDEFGEGFISFARQFYPLDIYEKSSDEVTLTVVNPISKDNNELEFWIWNNAGHKYPLLFKSFEEYLISGIENKFVVGWQYFYVDTKAINFLDQFTKEWLASDFREAIMRMTIALENLNKYFPNNDWSQQEKVLNELKK